MPLSAAVATLDGKLKAAGIPISGVRRVNGAWVIDYQAAATGPQRTQGDALAAAFDGNARQPRPILDIYNAIAALTGAQKTAIGDDLFGVGQKWATNTGANRGSMFVIYALTLQGGLTAANLAIYKTAGAAMYAQDNPAYLVNPTFAPTINIPGDEPSPNGVV